MKTLARISILVLALTTLGCVERTEQTDSGGVLLEVEFVNSVFQVGVNDVNTVTLPTVSIDSIVVRINGNSSRLMDVQLDTIEVTFTRADTGTRVPPPFVFNVVGTVPVGGTLTYTNLPVMSGDQLDRAPLSDLQFENGGFDKETGAEQIKLNLTMRVFGRTVAGDEISSNARTQTIEFLPSLLTVF